MRSRTSSFYGNESDELEPTTSSPLSQGDPTSPLSELPSSQNDIGFRLPGFSAGPSDPPGFNSQWASPTPQSMREAVPDEFRGNGASLPNPPKQVRGKAVPSKRSPVKRATARNKKRGAPAIRGGKKRTAKPDLLVSGPAPAKLAPYSNLGLKSKSNSQMRSAETTQDDPQRVFDASPEEQPTEAQGWTSHLPSALEPLCDEIALSSRRTSSRTVQKAPSATARSRVLNIRVGKRGREFDPPSPSQSHDDSSSSDDDQPMIAYVAPLPFHEAEASQKPVLRRAMHQRRTHHSDHDPSLTAHVSADGAPPDPSVELPSVLLPPPASTSRIMVVGTIDVPPEDSVSFPVAPPVPIRIYSSMAAAAIAAGLPADEEIPLIGRAPITGDRPGWQGSQSVFNSTVAWSTAQGKLDTQGTVARDTIRTLRSSRPRVVLPAFIDVDLRDTSKKPAPVWTYQYRLQHSQDAGRNSVQSGSATHQASRQSNTTTSSDPIFTPFSSAAETSQAGPGYWTMHIGKLPGSSRSNKRRLPSTRPVQDETVAASEVTATTLDATVNDPASRVGTPLPESELDSDKDHQPRKRQKRRLDGWQVSTAPSGSQSSQQAPSPRPPKGKPRGRPPKSRLSLLAKASPSEPTQKPREFDLLHVPDKPLTTASWSRVRNIVPVVHPQDSGDGSSTARDHTSFRTQQSTLQGLCESIRYQMQDESTALVMLDSRSKLFKDSPNFTLNPSQGGVRSSAYDGGPSAPVDPKGSSPAFKVGVQQARSSFDTQGLDALAQASAQVNEQLRSLDTDMSSSKDKEVRRESHLLTTDSSGYVDRWIYQGLPTSDARDQPYVPPPKSQPKPPKVPRTQGQSTSSTPGSPYQVRPSLRFRIRRTPHGVMVARAPAVLPPREDTQQPEVPNSQFLPSSSAMASSSGEVSPSEPPATSNSPLDTGTTTDLTTMSPSATLPTTDSTVAAPIQPSVGLPPFSAADKQALSFISPARLMFLLEMRDALQARGLNATQEWLAQWLSQSP